jgi:hypothetical protein
MAKRDSLNSIGETMRPMALLHMGEVAATWQKEMLEACEQFNRAWLARVQSRLARVQSEVALWSELATKLTATRSVPEALEAYTKWAARQMQMTAEDGQRLLNSYQEITQRVTKSVTRPVAVRKQGKSSRARHASR